MAIPFLKMQAAGNDFVVVDDVGKPPFLGTPLTPELARRICDRRFGVGADQVLWLRTASAGRDARMEVLNADGTSAETCGNGLRAVALYLFRRGPRPHRGSYMIETAAGVSEARVIGPQGGKRPGEQGESASVGMGAPRLAQAEERVRAGGKEWGFRSVDMGNPHAVIFVPDVSAVALETVGPELESHARFAPARTNVEFTQVLGPGRLRVRVWERGAGVTLACGSGACAAAAAAIASGRVAPGDVEVEMPGGALTVAWDGTPAGVIRLAGEAAEIFRGEFYV